MTLIQPQQALLTFGCQNMSKPLKRVLMRRPGESLRSADAKRWHYGARFDGRKAIAEYDRFADIIVQSGADIIWLEDTGDGLADAMFTHDPSLVSDHGAIILRMGKVLRAGEELLHRSAYQKAGIPILGTIEAPGNVEGGDCVWIDDKTLVVGRGVRTNQAGIEQLQTLLAPHGVDVLGFDLPLYMGFEACLHLMSIISPLAPNLALIYQPLFPVALSQLLVERGYQLISAPGDEFNASHGLCLNVLPLAPHDVVMVAGFEKTKGQMETAGCHVTTFKADALCLACEGGPTCLTRPILRK